MNIKQKYTNSKLLSSLTPLFSSPSSSFFPHSLFFISILFPPQSPFPFPLSLSPLPPLPIFPHLPPFPPLPHPFNFLPPPSDVFPLSSLIPLTYCLIPFLSTNFLPPSSSTPLPSKILYPPFPHQFSILNPPSFILYPP